jgi:DHA2 family multidrug resistance protein
MITAEYPVLEKPPRVVVSAGAPAARVPKTPRPQVEAAYRNKWPIAIGVILAAVMELVDSSIVNVAFSKMSASLGATIDEITWVAVGYILAAVIVLPMTGWLGARFGRKRYFLSSVAVFTAASVLCGTSTSLEGLVAWRIVQGLGGGALISTSQAILFESFPAEEKAMAAALFGIGMMIGPALGPTLGGIIVERSTWPWIFLVNVPFGVLAFLLVAGFYRADQASQRSKTRIDAFGFALLVIGIGALQFVLERGEHYDWFESHLIVSLTATATISLLTMIWWELRTDAPVIDLRVLRHPSLASAAAQSTAIGMALYGSIFALPLYLQSLLQFDAETTGYLILPSAIASAVTMLIAARIARVSHPALPVALGTLILAASMFMHGTLTTQSGSGDIHLPIILRGIGFGMIFVPVTTAAFVGLSPREMPHGTALFNLMRQLGGSIGIAAVATKLTTATARHRAALVEHVTAGDPLTRERLAVMTRALRTVSTDSITASHRALAALDHQVEAQAQMLAYRDVFVLLGIVVLASLPLVLLLRRPPRGAPAPSAAH